MLKIKFYLFSALFLLILLNLYLKYASLWIFSIILLLILLVSNLKRIQLYYKRKKSKIRLLILTIVICFVILELVAGLYLPRHTPEFFRESKDPNLVYELKEGYEGYFNGLIYKIRMTNIKISNQGLRDKEFEVRKPENTFRIVCLGDSFTFGWGVETNETFCKRIESYLNANSSTNYETLNFGIPGYNAKQLETLLRKKIIGISPDMIIYAFSPNDLEPVIPIHNNKDSLHLFLTKNLLSYRFFFVSFYSIIDHFKEENSEVYEKKEKLKELKSLIKYLEQLKSEKDVSILVVILFEEGGKDAIKMINNSSFPSLNMPKEVDLSSKQYVIRGDNHPNALGHKLIFEKIIERIEEESIIDVKK